MNLEGKIVNFLGDSITEGAGVVDRANCRYDNVIAKNAKLAAVYNYGIGGTRLAHQQKASDSPRHDLCFCGRAHDLNPAADLVVVYGGVNDYLHGDAPIGEIGDTTPATFCGGVYYLMKLLKTNFIDKGKKVAFLTPARCHRPTQPHTEPSKNPRKGPDAQPLSYYVEVIKKTGESFGIPVLDLYNELGLDPVDEEIRAKYTMDGLHFNDAGHAILAACVQNFLERI